MAQIGIAHPRGVEYQDLPVIKRKTYAIAPQRYYLKVKGVAVRAKYKIPIPAVITIAGEKAVRVGNGRFKHKCITGSEADTPYYMAMWEQTYTVDKTVTAQDIMDSIHDTGASAVYM